MYNYKMRIAVCNRNKFYLKSIKLMIYSYAEKKKIDVMVECYLCGKDMLVSDYKYNIVFLEYCIDSAEGTETAKLLRQTDSFCSIIFTSIENRFGNDIFKVYPSGFLTYPITENELISVLNDYFHAKINGYPLLLKSGEDTVCLKSAEIVYLEADNKHCVVHLRKEKLSCNCTMRRVYDTLPKSVFLKINRAYVINSVYINKFNSEEVFLKTGDKLYISRNYRKDFKQNYYDFISAMQL